MCSQIFSNNVTLYYRILRCDLGMELGLNHFVEGFEDRACIRLMIEKVSHVTSVWSSVKVKNQGLPWWVVIGGHDGVYSFGKKETRVWFAVWKFHNQAIQVFYCWWLVKQTNISNTKNLYVLAYGASTLFSENSNTGRSNNWHKGLLTRIWSSFKVVKPLLILTPVAG